MTRPVGDGRAQGLFGGRKGRREMLKPKWSSERERVRASREMG